MERQIALTLRARALGALIAHRFDFFLGAVRKRWRVEVLGPPVALVLFGALAASLFMTTACSNSAGTGAPGPSPNAPANTPNAGASAAGTGVAVPLLPGGAGHSGGVTPSMTSAPATPGAAAGPATPAGS